MPFYWLFLLGTILPCFSSSSHLKLHSKQLTEIGDQIPVLCGSDGQDYELAMIKCFYRFTEYFRTTSYDDFEANFKTYLRISLLEDYDGIKKRCTSFGQIISCIRQYACESVDISLGKAVGTAYHYATAVCAGFSQKDAKEISACGVEIQPKLEIAVLKGTCSEEFINDVFQQFEYSCRKLSFEQVEALCKALTFLMRGYCVSDICHRIGDKVWNSAKRLELLRFEELVNDRIADYNKELPAIFEQVQNGNFTHLITKF